MRKHARDEKVEQCFERLSMVMVCYMIFIIIRCAIPRMKKTRSNGKIDALVAPTI